MDLTPSIKEILAPSDAKAKNIEPSEGKDASTLDTQVGGDHYSKLAIQPVEYITKNKLSYLEGNVIKYLTRHRFKGGKEDLLKAQHYIEMILEMEYEND